MTTSSTILKSGILQETRQPRIDHRQPEDSGEWSPVPLQFRHLAPPPPVWGRREVTADRRLPLKSWAHLLTPLQLALGTATFFLGACLPDAPDSIWWLFVTPAFVGFFSTLCVTLHATDNTSISSRSIVGTVMRAQLWWGLLLLIPCYGWGVLLVCVPPCAIGTLIGTLAACAARGRSQKRVMP